MQNVMNNKVSSNLRFLKDDDEVAVSIDYGARVNMYTFGSTI